ncbi:hypothetical protein [Halobacillus sp. H74]|uniref:hypothetical protein n=1 Tax=Halobacillus sp. H74 TaxID=3457436 RepID=UPI003FCCEFB0
MVLRRDGFGGSRFYPENGEITVLCTYINTGYRYVIIRYLDLPFSYRLINRDGILLLEEQVCEFLLNEVTKIDEGYYDDPQLAKKITALMK